MSTAGEKPAFFNSMGSDSPARPRQKFCGVFCPVEGSSDSKTLNFDSLSACRGRSNDRVIDRQTDISQPRKVEIRDITGKEALQNLDDKRVIFSVLHLQFFCQFIFGATLGKFSLQLCCELLYFAQNEIVLFVESSDCRESMSPVIRARFERVRRPTCCNYVSHKALCYNGVDKRPTMPSEGVAVFPFSLYAWLQSAAD